MFITHQPGIYRDLNFISCYNYAILPLKLQKKLLLISLLYELKSVRLFHVTKRFYRS